MAEIEAIVAADSVWGWKHDVVARLRDIVARRLPTTGAVERVVRFAERRLAGALGLEKLKESLVVLRARLARRGVSPEQDAAVTVRSESADAASLMLSRIRAAERGRSIECYASFLFSVEPTL